MTRPVLLIAAALLLLPTTAWGIEKVSIRREGKVLKLEGKVVQEDAAGSLFLLSPDGVIWTLTGAEVVERASDDKPFKPLSRDELSERILMAMPAGCKAHHTEHYLICYNTSSGYAEWCGSLYERFYAAFHEYWKELGWKLHDPEMPLVALVFDDKDSYGEYARPEIGDGVNSIVAYYNFGTNRVAMYDQTGVDARGKKVKPLSAGAAVAKLLAAKGASFNVATIVHEGAHQLAFNCGLHQRFADLPLWILEGLAVYFETPDMRKEGKEWETIGDLNKIRLTAFRDSLKRHQREGVFERLLTNDKRFKAATTFKDSYSEAWALNYYLLHERKQHYVEYLQMLAKKEPGIVEDQDERLASFKKFFGNDLKRLESDFLTFMRKQN